MSLGYAEKLSYRDASFLGKLGAPEKFEGLDEVEAKVEELAALVRESKHMVVYTGAGISTSCGIPDFRGPKGIWTLQASGKPVPQASCSFARARPSYTHMALKALVDAGKVQYIVSQNVDCLHLRSGIPRCQLAELHGNCFREVCPKCGVEYIRDFELSTVGLKATGRSCTASDCRGRLRDSVLDWEDALPPDELRASERHSEQADLALCLGTSLQIVPARDLPFKCTAGGGKVVIVNLQATPRDKKATLVVHAKADEVMQRLMQRLDMEVPPYVRVDRLVVVTSVKQSQRKYATRQWTLTLQSTHGPKAPLAWVKCAKVSFGVGSEAQVLEGPKFAFKGTFEKEAPILAANIELDLVAGTAVRHVRLRHSLQNDGGWDDDIPDAPDSSASSNKLRTAIETASGTGRAGAVIVSPQTSAGAGGEQLTEYAFITDVIRYEDDRQEVTLPEEPSLELESVRMVEAENPGPSKQAMPGDAECKEEMAVKSSQPETRSTDTAKKEQGAGGGGKDVVSRKRDREEVSESGSNHSEAPPVSPLSPVELIRSQREFVLDSERGWISCTSQERDAVVPSTATYDLKAYCSGAFPELRLRSGDTIRFIGDPPVQFKPGYVALERGG